MHESEESPGLHAGDEWRGVRRTPSQRLGAAQQGARDSHQNGNGGGQGLAAGFDGGARLCTGNAGARTNDVEHAATICGSAPTRWPAIG